MNGTVRIAITRDLFDEEKNLIVPGAGLSLIEELAGVEYEMIAEFLPAISPEQVGHCDMVISGAAPWKASSVNQDERLIAVLAMGVGYDHIDVQALTGAGVILCSAPDAVRRPMAIAIVTHMLALATKLLNKDKLTREGRWNDRTNYKGEGLTGKTLGVIGVGNIGQELLLLAKTFDMRLLACDPYASNQSVVHLGAELVEMNQLLSESDFVSVCVPLNGETRHLIDGDALQRMKSTAYLINTSRGSVVDELALVEALQKGTIQGAGLDVFEQEPVDAENALLKMENVVVSPHSLCHTDEYYMTAWSNKLRQVQEIMTGKIPEALVNQEAISKANFQRKFARIRRTD